MNAQNSTQIAVIDKYNKEHEVKIEYIACNDPCGDGLPAWRVDMAPDALADTLGMTDLVISGFEWYPDGEATIIVQKGCRDRRKGIHPAGRHPRTRMNEHQISA